MKKRNNFTIAISLVTVFSAGLLCVASASAQSDDTGKSSGSDKRSINSRTKEDSALLSVFETLAISASESTVKVQNGRLQIAVGTIVDSSGLVLTKASEMRGDLKCRLPNGDLKPATVFGIDIENDLALLKIEAEGLAAAPLVPVESPTRGMWLVSPTDQKGALTVGVVGVNERKIPPSRAFIGIRMTDLEDGGVLIFGIVDDSPAQKAKLRPQDIIVKIDDQEIEDRATLVEALGTRTPGTSVTLTINRKEKGKEKPKELKIKLILGDATAISPMNSRSRTQNSHGQQTQPPWQRLPSRLSARHGSGKRPVRWASRRFEWADRWNQYRSRRSRLQSGNSDRCRDACD